MAKFSLSLLLALSLLAFSPLCLCHKYQGGYLFPQFYDHSCPRAQEIVKSVVAKASGGPNWEVPLGRRDSRGASLSGSNNDIPAPNNTFQTILTKFKRQGLDLVDLVALSGSHTIGDARCTSFRQRLYNQNGNGKPDFTLHPTYAAQLRNRCPRSGSDQNLFFLDFVSPTRFDNTYFKNLLASKGLLSSDQVLVTSSEASKKLVIQYAENNELFFEHFAKSMIKMGNISPLTGSRGEIRKNCRRINNY
ncbi:hypothetical protein F8388_009316 [Cannabis sativa]|uniref:peroxidase n=1 Tax=Cannabis sativa TaxID=3483 RepID=A0A7J6GK29_CANSA|nr:hypothetical protein F8388_009316 [Cannabis sativa]